MITNGAKIVIVFTIVMGFLLSIIGTAIFTSSLNKAEVEPKVEFINGELRTISKEYIGNTKRPEGWVDETALMNTFHHLSIQKIKIDEHINGTLAIKEDSLIRIIAVTKDSIGYLELHPIGRYTITKTINWSE